MKTILLVEDQEKLRELYSDVLTSAGYQVSLAENGEAGIKLAESLQPDLILMDINMPVMDGLRATEALKAGESTATIPIIALTSSAMPEEVEAGLGAGCDGYIIKPINPNELQRELEVALQLLEEEVYEAASDTLY